MPARNVTRGTVVCDRIEPATSLWARFMGLMGRPALAPGDGLWLRGTNGIHMFFMRFAIDAVFLSRPDADGLLTVRSVHRGLRPWRGIVPFVRGADSVLELATGSIDASATAPGDHVRLGD